jgi:hypothetical protein
MSLRNLMLEDLERGLAIFRAGHEIVPSWRILSPEGDFVIVTRFDPDKPDQRADAGFGSPLDGVEAGDGLRISASARGDTGRMLLATLLKTRQDLGYFAAPDEVHADTAAYLGSQMGLAVPPIAPDEERRTKTLYRYQAAVRAHLSVTAVPHPPRFRALALFRRRPPERVDGLAMPASENLHTTRLPRCKKDRWNFASRPDMQPRPR